MRWAQVRAGLIAIAIAFGLVDGCPLPPRSETPEWERGFVEPLRDVQRVLEWPVAWIVPRLRISQRWALYQAPGTKRYRMTIEGETADQTWHVVYRAGDPEHAEDAEVIERARVVGAWDPTAAPPGQYALFAGWETARVLARHPEFAAARVRMENVELDHGEVIGSGDYVFPFVRTRP